MPARIRWAVALTICAAVLAGVQVAKAPTAEAATSLCNSNSPVGAKIYSITPSGSFRRNIYAKICVVWDSNSLRNSTKIFCRTDGGNGCDIRAEVQDAHLDEYSLTQYITTLEDEYFQAIQSGYMADWSWLGNDHYMGTNLCTWRYQANDANIRVRFGFDGVLRNVGNAFSARGDLC